MVSLQKECTVPFAPSVFGSTNSSKRLPGTAWRPSLRIVSIHSCARLKLPRIIEPLQQISSIRLAQPKFLSITLQILSNSCHSFTHSLRTALPLRAPFVRPLGALRAWDRPLVQELGRVRFHKCLDYGGLGLGECMSPEMENDVNTNQPRYRCAQKCHRRSCS